MVRSQVLLEAAFFQAQFRHNTKEARDLFSKAQPSKALEKHLPARAESAILLAEGNIVEARKKARESLGALGGSFSAGTAKLEREWLEGIVEAGDRQAGKTHDEKKGA